MFKTRKLESLSLHKQKTSTSRYGLKKAQKSIIVKQYSLYAKAILHQIDEQIELGVIKKQAIKQKCNQILNLVKKCDHVSRCEIMVKLINLYRQQKIKLTEELFQRVDETIGFLASIANNNPDKLSDLIVMDRMDECLILMVKSYPEQRQYLFEKIKPIIKRFEQIKAKMGKIMPKKDYQVYIASINYWSFNPPVVPQKQSTAKKAKQQRKSNASNCSVYSKISEPPEAYEQRLKRFDETRENEQFRKNLQILSQNKKKKIFRRSNSIVSVNAKRVSTTWGKQEPPHPINSKQIIRKNQGSAGLSKFTNTTRKSVVISQNFDIYQDYFNREVVRLTTENSVVFRPFFFYTIIKDNMRLVLAKKVELLKDSNKLKIHLDGYFNYPLLFHKFHPSFLQSFDSEKIKKFLVTHTKLKQKRMWSILYPILKIQPENDTSNKNVISQLLSQNEKYVFYGFIKKYNVFFFTKYSSQRENKSKGNLTIYNSNLQQQVEELQISNWTRDILVQFNREQGLQSSKQFNSNFSGIIGVTQFNCKAKAEQPKNRHRFALPKKIEPNIKKANNKKQLFHTVKKDGTYVVISQKTNEKQIICSNLCYESRYRNLYMTRKMIKGYKISQKSKVFEKETTQKFISRLNRKNSFGSLSILNRRTDFSTFTRIHYQLVFVTKIQSLGYGTCRLFLFHPEQGQLILTEVYLAQNQKYYTFSINPSIFFKYFKIEDINNHEKVQQFAKEANNLIKVRKLKNTNSEDGRLSLALQIGELRVEGEELLYRFCKNNMDHYPQFISEITLNCANSSENKIQSLQIHRRTYRMCKNLQNKKHETLKLCNKGLIRKYSQYNEFIRSVKLQMKKQKPIQQIFTNKKKTYIYVPFSRRYKEYNLNKIEVSENQLRISAYQKGSDNRKQCSIGLKGNNFNIWREMAKGNYSKKAGITKLMGRFMKDPLLYGILFKQTEFPCQT